MAKVNGRKHRVMFSEKPLPGRPLPRVIAGGLIS